MRIFDAFLFSNEFRVVRARFDEWLHVPRVTHVVIESDETFSGHRKRTEWRDRAESEGVNLHNVLHEVCRLPPDPDPWIREAAQRNALYGLLTQADPEAEDVVLLTDADEIIDPSRLEDIVDATETGPVCLNMDTFVYDLGHRLEGPWPYPKAARWRHLSDDLHGLRLYVDLPVIERAGWHLSYFGGAQSISLKLQAFAHTEYAGPEFSSVEAVEARMGEHLHITGDQLVVGDYEFPQSIRRALGPQ